MCRTCRDSRRGGEGGIRTHEAFAQRFSRPSPSTTRPPLPAGPRIAALRPASDRPNDALSHLGHGPGGPTWQRRYALGSVTAQRPMRALRAILAALLLVVLIGGATAAQTPGELDPILAAKTAGPPGPLARLHRAPGVAAAVRLPNGSRWMGTSGDRVVGKGRQARLGPDAVRHRLADQDIRGSTPAQAPGGGPLWAWTSPSPPGCLTTPWPSASRYDAPLAPQRHLRLLRAPPLRVEGLRRARGTAGP